MRPLSVPLALAAALLAAPAPPAHALAARWQRAATPHFVLYARAERDSVLRLARNLESMAEVLEREGFGVRAAARTRVTLVAFPDKQDFLPLLPVRDGKRAQVSGLAHQLPWGTWIGFAAYDDRGRMVAHHELLHAIVGAALGGAPLCMNEGLAEFYSTWQASERGGRFGAPIPWHQHVLRNAQPFTLDELFAVDTDSPVYRKGGDSGSLFYAESWALMHYLMRLDGRSKRFRDLALAIASGTPPRKAFAKAYPGENWDEIPGQLSSYLDSDRARPWEIRLESPLAQLPVQVREATPAEVDAHTGLWLSLESEVDAGVARSLLERGRADDREPALALAGLGVVARRQGRAEQALAAFRGVGATPDAAPLALSIAGAEMLAHALGDNARYRALATESCALLARSVARDSSDAVALGWYGRAALASGQLTPRAMRALETAANALPTDGPVASAWAAALSHAGQADRAREVLRTHGGLSQDRDAQSAAEATIAYDAFRDSAAALAKAGRYAELERLLDRTQRNATDRQLIEALASVRRQLEEARVEQRHVDRYNEGVRLLRANELEKASAAFAAVRDSSPDPKLREQAAARVAELAGMIEFDRGMKAYGKKDYPVAAAAFERARELATTDELRQKAAKNAALMRQAAAQTGATKKGSAQ
jgi:hypothetical protein